MRKIMIFTDLGGTLINEEKETYSEEELFKLFGQITRLEELEEAKASIHIVSPMFEDRMEQVLDKIDNSILHYNKVSGKSLNFVDAAMAFENDPNDINYRGSGDRRIIVMPFSLFRAKLTIHGTEKANYVRNCMEAYSQRFDVSDYIYMGNGGNDLGAMREVKSAKDGRGIVICPQNSKDAVKAVADYTSDKAGILGLVDGLSDLCRDIEKNQEQTAPADPDDSDDLEH